eukprot:jgi/Mesvir1/16766/Mv15138-RA.1
MYSLRDAMAQACKDTEAMMQKMSFSSDVKLRERKQQAWAELVKQQPKELLQPRSEAEKKSKRAEKNKIYEELKTKNGGKACVYTKNNLAPPVCSSNETTSPEDAKRMQRRATRAKKAAARAKAVKAVAKRPRKPRKKTTKA